jgi:hypothetical protein
MCAMLRLPWSVLARPTYSSINLGGWPAAATRLGAGISSGMIASIPQDGPQRCPRRIAGGLPYSQRVGSSDTVGVTSWRTSIFTDRKAGTYLLPVRKTVRDAENLEAGADVRARVRIAGL